MITAPTDWDELRDWTVNHPLEAADLIGQLRGHQAAVEYAWNVEGPAPEYHRAAQKKLHRDWPRLAQAVEAMASS
ncbi:MAG: hypothetical protein MUP76_09800 [Acidimicrobiia bacterium]|nr:hypothetical protein [Acidimicrobiia bacterium]